jgi:hypothetical protein
VVLPAQQVLFDLLDAVTAVRMGNHVRAARLTSGDDHTRSQMLATAVSLLASLVDEAHRGGDIIAYLDEVVQPLIYV